ncbi:TonB-dependent receptor domain-containing protein [Arsukibacterium perlucidum]|uniref:TonB-dependent receptor domain-containing protein n=1 Tax=Arsukibacterium perlucidum TaxID=368811 RepID=UPI000370D254|nr:TonB-dependent receptor [Arsukibacterium perlucidum]
MHIIKFNLITVAIISTISALAQAEEMLQASEQQVEVLSVVGKRVSYANNTTNNDMQHLHAPIANVLDLVNNLPGVNVGQGDAFGSDDYTTTISMRGFVIDRADQQLGITIDGVPNGGSAYAGGSKANRYMDSENTRYVEVGQGASDIASASLDALGGTLNFVSDNPDMKRGARVGISNGSHNARRYFARYDSGEIFGNTTAYFSLSDSYHNRWIGSGSNGYSNRLHIEAKSITELDAGRVTARLSYNDAHEDNYDYRSLEQFKQNPRWDGLTNVWTGNPDIDQNFAEAWSTLRENTLLYVKAEFDVSDSIEMDVTPYLHLQNGRGDWLPPYQVYATDAAGNQISNGNGANRTTYNYVDANGQPILDSNADTSGARRVASYRHTHYEKQRFGVTANLNWTLDNQLIRAGVWLEQQDRSQIRDWHKVLDPKVYHYFDQTPYWVQFDDDYQHDVVKFYLQDTLTFGDLQLVLGVQQYLIDIERTDNFNPANNGNLDSDSDLLPSIGLVYRLSERIELFAGYAENFKAIPDTILNTAGQEFADLEAETADNFDLGLRYFGETLNLSATYYKVKFNNRITLLSYSEIDDLPDYLTELDGTFVNVGGVKSDGLETSLEWRFAPHFSLTSSLTLNNAEYSETINGYRAGDKVAAIPEQMLVAALNYNDGNYRAGISGKYTADYYGAAKRAEVNGTNVWNRDSIPSSTVWNAYFGYRHEMADSDMFRFVDMALTLNNVTDQTYITGGQEGAYLLGAERTASFTVSLGF